MHDYVYSRRSPVKWLEDRWKTLVIPVVVLAILGGVAFVATHPGQARRELAAAAYAAPNPGDRVTAERATLLTQQGDGQWAADQGYWPARYTNTLFNLPAGTDTPSDYRQWGGNQAYWPVPYAGRYFNLPAGTDTPSGEVAYWCRPDKVMQTCQQGSLEHPYFIVAGDYDTKKQAYTSVKLVGLSFEFEQDGKYGMTCTTPSGRSRALEGMRTAYRVMSPTMRTDLRVHQIVREDNEIWRCQSSRKKTA